MPVKDKSVYPINWKQIRERILERDQDECKFCYVPNGMIITRDDKGNWWEAFFQDGEHFAFTGHSKPIRIVLTIAHLDHDPSNNADDNLAALCQRCHLRHDIKQHVSNAAVTRRLKKEAAGQGNIFA